MDDDEGSGDATRELRKVMEDRKKSQMMKARNPQHHRYSSNNPRGSSQYASFSSSTNISPTTITDPDGATPSSRSGTTRCVCNNPDSEGFMIQWYVLLYAQGELNLHLLANPVTIGSTLSASALTVEAFLLSTFVHSVPILQI